MSNVAPLSESSGGPSLPPPSQFQVKAPASKFTSPRQMYRHALAQHLHPATASSESTDHQPSIDQVVLNSRFQREPPAEEAVTPLTISETPPLTKFPSGSTLRDRFHSPGTMPPLQQSSSRNQNGNGRPLASGTGTGTGTFTNGNAKQQAPRESDENIRSSRSNTQTLTGSATLAGSGTGTSIADFFSPEVFRIVLNNPTTAHRFLRFCQTRACGEHMEFLQKVEKYSRLLDEVSQELGTIQSTYLAPGAPRQINVSHQTIQHLSQDIRSSTHTLLPRLEDVFGPVRRDLEKMLASDMYPRFVKHQVTAQAALALADQRERFQGLGDCFCLTDPSIADNPITFASDGFVSVTGYTRKDIIPRNCRFLQGDLTDRFSTKRLRQSIDNCEETVELLLNYRKNGDPFWNLLYIAPLFNAQGEVSFFLGGQVNCSTTIHTFTDVLRVLSYNEDELDDSRDPSVRSLRSGPQPPMMPSRSAFFKSWRKYSATYAPGMKRINVREDPGMETELVDKMGKLNFKTQVEAFYTAYSKYIVMSWNNLSRELLIEHYSTGIIDMLGLNLPNGGIAPIFGKDIFKVLLEHSSPSSSVARAVKGTVVGALREGRAVSVEVGLLTGVEQVKKRGGWLSGSSSSKEANGGNGVGDSGWKRKEERFVTHWTPMKGENGGVGYVVLSVAPK